MSNTLESLQAQVAGLSVADQSRLLEHLIASLDVDHNLEAAWEAVADLREAEAASGRSTAVPLGDALARLEARFPSENWSTACGRGRFDGCCGFLRKHRFALNSRPWVRPDQEGDGDFAWACFPIR